MCNTQLYPPRENISLHPLQRGKENDMRTENTRALPGAKNTSHFAFDATSNKTANFSEAPNFFSEKLMHSYAILAIFQDKLSVYEVQLAGWGGQIPATSSLVRFIS
jgi:hypothetical protein